MDRPLHTSLAALCCAALAACAGPGAPPRPPQAVQAETQQAEAARARVVPGKSTRADVRAALGKPIAVPFGSGYEVWVYRWGHAGHADSATELVILYSPDGVVKKSRVRPGDAAPG